MCADAYRVMAQSDVAVVNGGDGYGMFMDNVLLQDCVMLDNQVLINHIAEYMGGSIGEEYAESYGSGRIIVKK